MKIKKGYYIKARQIQESKIATQPPHVREIWDWLLKECNHTDNISSGRTIKRGQCVRTYSDIQEGLKWFVGYRKMTYKKHHCENALKWLTKETMITKTKTTRGILITVCNYDFYQNPENYESHTRTDTSATMKLQGTDTINKNDKNDNKYIYSFWNEKKIVNHRKLTDKMVRKINGALKNYSVDEIKKAISNYSIILKSDDYFWTYQWTLEDFLQRGLEKFMDLEKAKNNYRKSGNGGSSLPARLSKQQMQEYVKSMNIQEIQEMQAKYDFNRGTEVYTLK